MDISTILQKLIEFLEQTGTTLAQAGFKIAVKQAIVSGWTDILAFGLVFILGIALLIFSNTKHRETDDEVWIFGIVFGILAGILGLFTVVATLPKLLNPEWYAVKSIIELVIP